MLVLDRREDADLVAALARHDVPTLPADERPELEFGDACWEGNGPAGRVLVGVERKRLDAASQDLVTSIQERRLVRQLHGMRRAYDYRWLLVEGLWRAGEHGGIDVLRYGRGWGPLYHNSGGPLGKRNAGVRYDAIANYLTSVTTTGGVRVWRVSCVEESAAWLASEYRWWQKAWHEHKSQDALYVPEVAAPVNGQHKAAFWREEPDLRVLWAAALAGVDAKAWDVGKSFDSAYDLATADADEWREKVSWVDATGKRKHMGKKVTEEIVAAIRRRQS